MDIAVFAEAPEAVSPATATRGAGEIPRGEAGETGYTQVQELFDTTRFGERMNLASRPAGPDGPASRPADPPPTVPATTDRTADAPARGVRAAHHHHPIPEPGRTPAALRERTRE
ncbi:hypothetical protein ABZZ36_19915 [Actinacidiphila glaucinigra]|uniref:hypothetical protein n=1 Tax=Actinacidiphila glaucinigra TaxID=235986 RepID=UPI00339EAF98